MKFSSHPRSMSKIPTIIVTHHYHGRIRHKHETKFVLFFIDYRSDSAWLIKVTVGSYCWTRMERMASATDYPIVPESGGFVPSLNVLVTSIADDQSATAQQKCREWTHRTTNFTRYYRGTYMTVHVPTICAWWVMGQGTRNTPPGIGAWAITFLYEAAVHVWM